MKRVREHAPALAVLVLGCLVTAAAFVADARVGAERVALHADADAKEYEHTLQQGIDAYLHLSRDLAGYFTAAGVPTQQGFQTYARTADILREHPGLTYIGYAGRVARADMARFETAQQAADPGFTVQRAGAGSELFPYLYAYPRTTRAVRARGLDFAAVPERWSAMQQARDSGLSTVTTRHFYQTDPKGTAIVVVFTPVYDPARPAATVAERRAALRGFVFSVLEIDETIARVMGPGFDRLFDLEIYDGKPVPADLLYDADKRPHLQLRDRDFPLARHARVSIANRTWLLYFFPKPAYAARYRSSYGAAIVLFGLAGSACLSCLTGVWSRRMRRRARQRKEDLRFEAVFEKHPSGVYLLDLQRRFVNANSQALRELNVDKATLIGKPIGDLIVPEYRDNALSCFAQVLEGHSVSYDSAFINGMGGRVEVSVIMVPIMTDQRVTSVLGVAQNITERKMNEWRLKESRHMLSLVINHIPQGVFWKDTQLAYLGCNEAFCRDAGLQRPEEIVGKTDFDLPWRADAQAYRRDDLETMRRNEPRINYEERQHRDDGSERWLRTSKVPLTGIDGNIVALLGLYEDITERKLMEQQLKEMAHYDSLTGLANRAFFHHHLELVTLRLKRRRALAALLYLDLDNFKSVNDAWGHDVGDALLKAFAQRVRAAVRDTDIAARIGGDEFAVLLEDLPDQAGAISVASKLVAAMQLPFHLGGTELHASTSIGVAFLEPGMSGEDLIRRADQAMYRAKRGGRNRYVVDGGAA